jgi:hypothetical protein
MARRRSTRFPVNNAYQSSDQSSPSAVSLSLQTASNQPINHLSSWLKAGRRRFTPAAQRNQSRADPTGCCNTTIVYAEPGSLRCYSYTVPSITNRPIPICPLPSHPPYHSSLLEERVPLFGGCGGGGCCATPCYTVKTRPRCRRWKYRSVENCEQGFADGTWPPYSNKDMGWPNAVVAGEDRGRFSGDDCWQRRF